MPVAAVGAGGRAPSVVPLLSPLILGAKTDVTSANYTCLASDHFIRVNAGPADITLPSAAKGTAQDGQRIALVNFDTVGNLVRALPDVGDDIVGGTAYPFTFYGAMLELEARVPVAGGATHWLWNAGNTRDCQSFPIDPVLAAGAQGPIALGAIVIPQGPRSIRNFFVVCDAVLTGGSLSVALHGLVADPTTVTVNSGFSNNGSIFAPGNANRITVPGGSSGARLTASVSTVAGFGGATTCKVMVDTW